MAIDKNYYAILGVSKDVTIDELKKAYRRKVKEWHPDRNSSPQARTIIVEVNEAYEILSDPVARANYNILYEALFTTSVERFYCQQSDEAKVESVRRRYTSEVEKHENIIRNIKFDLRSLDRFLEEQISNMDHYIESGFYWVGKILLWIFGILLAFSIFGGIFLW